MPLRHYRHGVSCQCETLSHLASSVKIIDAIAMEIIFKQFRFLPQPQILYKDNHVIHLKPNQTALLNLFLSQPNTIWTKNAILDAVWADKVVSEQVVFQTISQLRVILGDDAIKTFPKKGYQWQLPIQRTQHKGVASVDEASLPHADLANTYALTSANSRTHKVWAVSVAGLVMLLMTVWAFYPKSDAHNAIPNTINLVTRVDAASTSEQYFQQLAIHAFAEAHAINPVLVSVSSQQLFSSPKLHRQQAGLEQHQWLMWGDSFTSARGTFLHYGLASDKVTWQGYVFGKSTEQLTRELNNSIQELARAGLFSNTAGPLNADKLTLMLQEVPHNYDVLLRLADQHIATRQLDIALTYLNQVRNAAQHYAARPYQARAHGLTGRVYKMRSQFEQAFSNLAKMATALEDTPLWPLNVMNTQTSALLAYESGHHDEMVKALERGLALARQQADPFSLFRLHILYAMLAEHTANHTQKHAQLNAAQALMIKHQLGDANRAIVYYYFAKFSDDIVQSIQYLTEVLQLPGSIENYWLKDDALRILVGHYIEQQEFELAEALLPQPLTSLNAVTLKAQLLLAQQQKDDAHALLIKGFDMARLKHNRFLGRQIANLLYQLSDQDPVAQGEYKAYLISNVDQIWLQNHAPFATLNAESSVRIIKD